MTVLLAGATNTLPHSTLRDVSCFKQFLNTVPGLGQRVVVRQDYFGNELDYLVHRYITGVSTILDVHYVVYKCKARQALM